MQSLILEGGIKGWASSGEEYRKLMEGYVATAWQK
jgi:arsenical-resistance protein 2